MKPTLLAILLILLIVPWVFGDDAASTTTTTPTPPCSTPEFRQFDFWLGDWDLVWSDTGRGRNTITSTLGDCVIEENFTTEGALPFVGRSLSTYNVRTGKWHQTWVDNSGAYLDFEGGKVGDSMILSRQAVDTSGNTFLQRMVWFDIEQNSLNWRWEKSTDSGSTWQTQWAIEYTRR